MQISLAGAKIICDAGHKIFIIVSLPGGVCGAVLFPCRLFMSCGRHAASHQSIKIISLAGMIYLKKILHTAFLAAGMASGMESRAQQPSLFLADPTIFADKGKYYLYGTGSNQGFLVYESADLANWRPAKESAGGFALKRGESFGSGGFWAPQVFKYKGSYYMAYTADEQIAIAKAPGPAGPFKQERPLALTGAGKQIDPFLFFDGDGKVYLYHVRLQNGNRIFVAEMKPDLSDMIPGTEKECISSTEGWENTAGAGWPVAEGPTVLKHKNTYYLVYSANDFRNKDYAVGYATAASPLGPWKKYQGNPIISRHSIGQNGPGHGDVFTDKQGKLHYVIHTHRSADRVSPRATAVLELAFKSVKDGVDLLEADAGSFKWLRTETSLKPFTRMLVRDLRGFDVAWMFR